MIDVGQSVGNYNIISKLGEGGMGTVFLAEHPVIGRKVALKAIHPQFLQNAEVISRFVTEAKSVNQIGHQHIVDITDFGSTPEGDFYFIMEYLVGDTLSASISRAGRFPTERALRIAAQIADALQASHEHGVIHRDLKPENIILIARDEDEDFVKVLDFGLAKLTLATEAPTHNTRTGSIMGTPYYMAPEQCEGSVVIDHRADIYALGVILFEMLTGKLPFGGNGYGEIIMKHMTTPPPAARSLVPDLSPALDQILFHALTKDPSGRFQTMAELRQALLDPEYFASTMPTRVAANEFSSRVRVAQPMARSEMALARGATAVAGTTGSLTAPEAPSTFRSGVGQLAEAGDAPEVAAIRPARSRAGAKILVAAALAASIVAVVKFRRAASRVVVTALAEKRPATVRFNFSSDPGGATVARADGTALGQTPLSTDVPFGDKGLEYVVRKPGYLPKTLAAVPNLAASLFAVMERDPAVAVLVESAIAPSSPADASTEGPTAPAQPPPERLAAIKLPPRRPVVEWTAVRPPRHHPAIIDDDPGKDDSMAPTVPDPDPAAADLP